MNEISIGRRTILRFVEFGSQPLVSKQDRSAATLSGLILAHRKAARVEEIMWFGLEAAAVILSFALAST